MANQDDKDDKKSKTEDEEVDTTSKEDLEDDTSTEDEDTTSTDDTEDEDKGSEEDDTSEDETEDEDSEDDDSKFKKQFSQFKGEDWEQYGPELEEGYRKSSREGKRLAQENSELQGRLDVITQAVAKNPELAKLIEDSTGEGAVSPVQDPALVELREERDKRMQKEYAEFVDGHPSLDTDEEIQGQVLEELKMLGAAWRAKGKILPMKKGLQMAWDSLGLDDDPKSKIAGAAKTTAGRSKTTNANKREGSQSSSKPKLTEAQVNWGKRMGLTEKQMLEHYAPQQSEV